MSEFLHYLIMVWCFYFNKIIEIQVCGELYSGVMWFVKQLSKRCMKCLYLITNTSICFIKHFYVRTLVILLEEHLQDFGPMNLSRPHRMCSCLFCFLIFCHHSTTKLHPTKPSADVVSSFSSHNLLHHINFINDFMTNRTNQGD